MMLATGCRIGECLAIGWTEVDLDGEAVDVCWRLVRQTGVGLLRLPSTKSGEKGERLIPLSAWAVEMLRRRRASIAESVEPVFPDSLGGWRDPTNVTVVGFLDDANVSTRKISDQLGHARVSMTQDRYLGRRITDRETADVLEGIVPEPGEQQ